MKNKLRDIVVNGFCFVGWLIVAIVYLIDWNASQIRFSH